MFYNYNFIIYIKKSLFYIERRARADSSASRRKDDVLRHVEQADLVGYGLIPEFVGRFPVISPLTALTEEELIEVLSRPKNSLLNQYRQILAGSGARLHATEEGLRAVAREAHARGVGARGLRSIMERILLDAMYHVRGILDTGSSSCLLFL
jgi:ATP-dependent Clp protease ATP-binding subunit ClpX